MHSPPEVSTHGKGNEMCQWSNEYYQKSWQPLSKAVSRPTQTLHDGCSLASGIVISLGSLMATPCCPNHSSIGTYSPSVTWSRRYFTGCSSLSTSKFLKWQQAESKNWILKFDDMVLELYHLVDSFASMSGKTLQTRCLISCIIRFTHGITFATFPPRGGAPGGWARFPILDLNLQKTRWDQNLQGEAH